MSIPYLKFSCDCCDYRESSLIAFGKHVWSDGGQLFKFYPRLAWCNNCNEIVKMEGIPSQEMFERARDLHPTLKGNISVILERDEAKWLAYQKEFDLLERVMKMNRPPVCLKCGTDAVTPLALPPEAYSETLKEVGMIHPGCGGKLMVQGSGRTRISLWPITYFFDINGKFLASLRE